MHLWALPLEVAYTTPTAPWDPSVPSAVRSEVRGRYVLQATSPEAQRLGIRPGATQSEARARKPELLIRDRDRGAEQRELERVAELLFAFGPVVEVCGPDLLFVEVGRSQKALARRLGRDYTETTLAQAILHALEKAGHLASVTICGEPEAGRTLVQHLSRGLMPKGPDARRIRGRGRARGVTRPAGKGGRGRWSSNEARIQIVAPGQEGRALSGLPVRALTWTDERRDPDGHLRERLVSAASSLRVLGVIDVGRLQAMPSAQIASRFGDAGHLLMARTRGQSARPLRLFRPPTRLVERVELDQVTEALEPVLFVLRGLIDRLAARLDARALSVTQVSLTFGVEPGLAHVLDADAPRARSSKREETVPLRLARPSRKAKTLFTLAQEKLLSPEGGLPGAVFSVRIEAVAPQADHGAQLDLFTAHEKRLEAVGELIGRLQATLGDDAVFSPRTRDTHRPETAWSRDPFDIDAALRAAPVTKPRVVEMTAIEGQGETRPGGAPLYALPEVGQGLSVTGAAVPEAADFASTVEEEAEAPRDPAKAKPWPKPVPREPEDEPLPPLPARPTVLFSRPERATLLRSAGGLDEGVLVWRGERHHLVRLSGFERLETEWWSSSPLERDYAVAETGDGRRFWVFFTPGAVGAETRGAGEAYVHGIFD